MEINPTWYTSIAGIVLATGIIVQILKRLIGNVSFLMDVPTWLYSVVVAAALTALSYSQGLLQDQGTLLELLMLAVLTAASASGFWSWFSNGNTPIGQSAIAQNARSDGPR